MRIIMSMPDKCLSPNARCHWAKKSKHARNLKNKAELFARLEGAAGKKYKSYQLHFIFPDRGRRDLDNFTARCKAALDGIALACGQDDSEWGMDAPTREVKKGHNEVIITMRESE